ncbi:MAG: hypothetical protein A2Z20_08075 [Bdellovibrionales bacterium RBG_16_40_8]|nr:MAG: hypothetical protein A2Z20_08075 [Bdellovibrionales bacterium RBG_16_40_8]
MNRKVSIRVKMVASFMGVALLLPIISLFNWSNNRKVTRHYEHVNQLNLLSTEVLQVFRQSGVDLMNRALYLGSAGVTAEEKKDLLGQISDIKDQYEMVDSIFATNASSDDERRQQKDMSARWKEMTSTVQRLAEMIDKPSTKPEELHKLLFTDLKGTAEAYAKVYTEAADLARKHSNDLVQQAEKTAKMGNYITIGLIAVGFIFATGMGLIFSIAFTRRLNVIVARLADYARECRDISDKILGANSELSTASSSQSASLCETTSAIEEISSMVNRNSDDAKNSSDASSKSLAKANEGYGAVEQMINAFGKVNSSSLEFIEEAKKVRSEFNNVVNIITEISSKTAVINDIVFQTKLLSFNASVEAARAGEHGKGFAVVAGEIGTLAKRSGGAANEISSLLNSSIEKVKSLVQESEQRVNFVAAVNQKEIDNSSNILKRCANLLKEIVNLSQTANSLANSIANASQEQSRGVTEVSIAIMQVSDKTQINHRMSEEGMAVSQQLSQIVKNLSAVMTDLQETIHGNNDTTEESMSDSYSDEDKSSEDSVNLNAA